MAKVSDAVSPLASVAVQVYSARARVSVGVPETSCVASLRRTPSGRAGRNA